MIKKFITNVEVISDDKVESFDYNNATTVTLNVKNDFLYVIDSVKVNDTSLVESETTSGIYTFALVTGENKVVVNFVIDQETLGSLSGIVQSATEKDWKNLFTVENVLTLVKWIFDGGGLLAMVGYFIKDKKLEKKIENKIQELMSTIITDEMKKTITENITKILKINQYKEFITKVIKLQRNNNII